MTGSDILCKHISCPVRGLRNNVCPYSVGLQLVMEVADRNTQIVITKLLPLVLSTPLKQKKEH